MSEPPRSPSEAARDDPPTAINPAFRLHAFANADPAPASPVRPGTGDPANHDPDARDADAGYLAPKPGRQPPLPIGEHFAGRYWLEAVIGQGGLATIYRARDCDAARQPRLVAVKIADTKEISPALRLAMMNREAACLESFNHPALPGLIDAGEASGFPFLVLPLIIGETLAEALRRMAPRGLGVARAVSILAELSDALTHMHGLELVHGDIKTSNILLASDGRLRLIDFSSTRWAGESAILVEGDVQAAATPVSTLFAAPEQIDGLPADPTDDVFALGVLANILLTGHHPFGRRNASEARRIGLPPGPAHVSASLPRHQREAIRHALAFSRAERFASPVDFMARLAAPRLLDTGHDVLRLLLRRLRG